MLFSKKNISYFFMSLKEYIQKYDTNIINAMVFLLFCIGCFIRLYFYFNHKSFWIDETCLATSIFEFNFFEFFTKSLLYIQSAPLGFLLTTKLLATLTTYTSHLTFYFIPLISSLFLLYIVYKFSLLCFNKEYFIIFASFILMSTPFLYYATEFKQYMTEATLDLFLIYYYIKNKENLEKILTKKHILILFMSLLFSTSIAFITVGILLTILYNLKKTSSILVYIKNNKTNMISIAAIFLIYYIVFLSKENTVHNMQEFWRNRHINAFVPLNADNVVSFSIHMRHIFTKFLPTYSFLLRDIMLLFFVFGMYRLFIIKRDIFLCLLFLMLCTITVSACEMYPIGVLRSFLFCFPLLLIPISYSFLYIFEKIIKKKIYIVSILAIFVSLVAIKNLYFIFSPPTDMNQKTNPRAHMESAQVIEIINMNKTSESTVLTANINTDFIYSFYQKYFYNKNNEHIFLKNEECFHRINENEYIFIENEECFQGINKTIYNRLDIFIEKIKSIGKTEIIYIDILENSMTDYCKERKYPYFQLQKEGTKVLFIDISKK